MKLFKESRSFVNSLLLLILLNVLVKPLWIFGIDREVQNITGYAAYGGYFALMNLSIVLNFLLDFGITPYFNRTVAAAHGKGRVLFSQAFSIKLLLGFFYGIIVFLVAWSSGALTGKLLFMLILMQVLNSFSLLLRSYLSASQQYSKDAWLSITDKLFVILAAGFVLLFPGISGSITINLFVVIQIIGLLVSIALGIIFLFNKISTIIISPFKNFDPRILRPSLPFALNIFFMASIGRADGFLLERLDKGGPYEAGIYASGFRLLDAVNMGGYLMASFLLPFISRNWPDITSIRPILNSCRHLLIFSGIIVAGVAWFYAVPINHWLYHARDPETGDMIRILLLCLVPMSIVHIYGTLLTATGNIHSFLRISGFFALANILANLFFIPRFGAHGAAWVAFATQTSYAVTVYTASFMKTSERISWKDILVYVLFAAFVFMVLK
jgi:O-antigen/teichoic acid export membrane protein